MKKIKLFITMSLDGYIADCNGGVGWLSGHWSDEENMDSYSAFVEDIDTIIMGYNTYNQIVTELSPKNGFMIILRLTLLQAKIKRLLIKFSSVIKALNNYKYS